jgi:hypothetical protein
MSDKSGDKTELPFENHKALFCQFPLETFLNKVNFVLSNSYKLPKLLFWYQNFINTYT